MPAQNMGELADLCQLAGRDLDPLLLDQTREWRSLDWDFSTSARSIRQLVDSKTLNGFALLHRTQVAGYAYSILQENKALIGDLYVRPLWRNPDYEAALFCAVLDRLIAAPHLSRIESQIMFMDSAAAKTIGRDRRVALFERALMTLDLASAAPPAPRHNPLRCFNLEPWADRFQGLAATLISSIYGSHAESPINDQLTSPAGARRLLDQIVFQNSSGPFFRGGSFAAFDRTGKLAGIVLASFSTPETCTISELCVAAAARGLGLGCELLWRAASAVRDRGAKRVSLSVTADNSPALRLYQRSGFRLTRRFFAYVWERPAIFPNETDLDTKTSGPACRY